MNLKGNMNKYKQYSCFFSNKIYYLLFFVTLYLCYIGEAVANKPSEAYERGFSLAEIIFPLILEGHIFVIGLIVQLLTLKIKKLYYLDYILLFNALYFVGEVISGVIHETPEIFSYLGENGGMNESYFTHFMSMGIFYFVMNIFLDCKRKGVKSESEPKVRWIAHLSIFVVALSIEQFTKISSGAVYTPTILLFVAALIIASSYLSSKSINHVIARFPRNFLFSTGTLVIFYYVQQYLLHCIDTTCSEYVFRRCFLSNYLRFFGYALILYGVDYVIRKKLIQKSP